MLHSKWNKFLKYFFFFSPPLQKEQINEDDHVDVDGDDSGEQYEEYTWMGETRIRATTMLEGGFAGEQLFFIKMDNSIAF